jgi:hypothetical protein
MSLIARLNRRIVVLLIAVTAFAFGPRVHSQQGQSVVLGDIGGTWVLDASTVAPPHPDRLPSRVTFEHVDGLILVIREGRPTDTFRTDGIDAPLEGFRTGRAVRSFDGALNLATRRVRPNQPNVTVVHEVYKPEGGTLFLTRTLRVILPNGQMAEKPQISVEARYRPA